MDRLRGLLVNIRCCGDMKVSGASELLFREYILGGGSRDPRVRPAVVVEMVGRERGGAGEVSGEDRCWQLDL